MTTMAMTIVPTRTIQKAKAKLGKVVLEHAVKATMVRVPRVTMAKVAPHDLAAAREMMMVMAKTAHDLALAHETMTTVKVAHAHVLDHEMMATGMVKADLGDPTVMTTHAHPVEGGPATAIETTATAMPAAMTVVGTEIVTIIAAMMASEKAVGDPTITGADPAINVAVDALAATAVAATTAVDVAETIIAVEETVAVAIMAVAIMAIAAITRIATILVAEIGITRTTTIQPISMKRT